MLMRVIVHRWNFVPTKEEMDFVHKKFGGDFLVPHNFARSVDAFEPKSQNDSSNWNVYSYTEQPPAQINSQTTAFCERLSVDDPMALLLSSSTDSSFDSSQSQLSCSVLPSQLTPECPGELTLVSCDDGSCLDALDDSVELKHMAKTCNNSCSQNSISSSPMVRRLSLALPSPQNSDVDEPVRNSADGFSSSPDSSQLSLSLPSPRDSDMDEPVCSDSHSSSQGTSGASVTGSEAVPETDGSQPKPKRFKRRNQAIYCSVDDG
ncbi:hypothetical protein Cfor_01614 [Coptotermes formosanus]|uniref:Lariat debranching enzyme C-terminal domain-containing protein n=1 Tax=Coptotermes formosanus TaxID=36987 RepID=A0A6L2QBM1_COPFO|nr:hypothetical protein Cfor_01614 [Coptotermes formosanus]